ncbi:MAG: DUF2271 domain-containing protein [Planctomycetota bacterium]
MSGSSVSAVLFHSLRTVPLLLTVSLALCGRVMTQSPGSDEYVFSHENILGTSLTMSLRARTESEAHKLEADVLAEVERLSQVVNSWDADSELRKAIDSHAPVVVSEPLAEVITACEHWRGASKGAFEPGVAALTALWQDAAKSGKEPDAERLRAVVANFENPPWSFDPSTRRFQVREGATVTVDALAKGWVIEKASAVKRGRYASVRVLDIGGDLRVRGAEPHQIGVADPRHPADNATPLAIVWLKDRAIASSGGYARGFDVSGVHHSHLLDPRTGRSSDDIAGATVIAADATTADALATILAVLGPKDGLPIVEAETGAAGIVVTRDGKVTESKGWKEFLARPTDPTEEGGPSGIASGPKDPSPWPQGFEFTVGLEIRDPTAGQSNGRRGGYRRPYVAIWVETASGEAVRTLALWAERPRWLSDLRRWYKLYRGNEDFIDAMSRATRKPGSYEVGWDGLDDAGKAVKPGDYVVCIEAAREHGTYQSMRQRVHVAKASFQHAIEGNEEIAGASVSFGERKSK